MSHSNVLLHLNPGRGNTLKYMVPSRVFSATWTQLSAAAESSAKTDFLKTLFLDKLDDFRDIKLLFFFYNIYIGGEKSGKHRRLLLNSFL